MTFLGDRLKELRGESSLMEIAREVGVSDVQILNFERGTRIPKKDMLKKLAQVFDVSYSELRKLYFTDLFSKDSEEHRLILEWAKEQ